MRTRIKCNLVPAKNMTRQRLFCLSLAVMLVVLSGMVGVAGAQQRRPSSGSTNQLVPQGSTDAATIMFRSGRDLITEAEWAKAQDKFSQFISTYPNDRKVDEAMYWMAYAQNKQAKTSQARETLNRLLEKYPSSSWREDARVLLAQTLGVASRLDTPSVYTISPSTTVAYAPAAPLALTPPPGQASVWSPLEAPSHPAAAADDDPCEFKIVVLQALFQTDVQRGIVVATEWLKPNSGQTVRCKGAALSLLGRNGGKAITPVILNFARTEQDVKLRARAISALGATNDDTVVDALRDFALTSQENDIVEASLYALSKHTGERAIVVLGEIASNSGRSASVRKVAISSIASRPGEPAVDALLRIYDADQTIEIRKAVISGFGNRKSERAGAKLIEIVRGSDVIELRKAAISAISRRGGEKVVEVLVNLYDTEKSEELKDQIMNAMGSGSVFYSTGGEQGVATTIAGSQSRVNDQRVIRKLIEIARNPQTPMERRKRAIGWLSRSNNPEVLKFLEELLK